MLKTAAICSSLILLFALVYACSKVLGPADARIGTPGGGNSSASVVVLVDLSKSFLPAKAQPGVKVGLSVFDQAALHQVAEQVALLATRYRTVKILWFPILAAAPTRGLCDPLEVTTSLVKHEGKVTTKEDVDKVVGACLEHIAFVSRDARALADNTDIPGALATAAEAATGDYQERVLIVFSDMKEDLVRSAKEQSFHFLGEKVILLHRPASDEDLDVQRYLGRIDDWKKRLLASGASRVMAMPLFSVSEGRLRAAFAPQGQQTRTSVTMLVDSNNGAYLPGARGDQPDLRPLVLLGKMIAELAPEWPQPVTAQWVVAADSGYRLRSGPPVEFWQKLIKPDNLLTETPDFARLLDETAQRIPVLAYGAQKTDLPGTIDIIASAEPAPQEHILVLISDFAERVPVAQFSRLSKGTRVLMLYSNAPQDRLDPNAGVQRRDQWAAALHNSGAKVCQYPLASWTQHDLQSCLSSNGGRY